ncbi:hypothetical protein Golob_019668, partial [Gossypium lobatum]|nr:hypothetical protein [Gossypium lobatum]
MEMKSKTLLILYATQTGNALDVAERIAREAERRACTVVIRSTDDYDAVFWRFLLQRNLGSHWLEGIHYAVFGLGDSGYQKYNFVAKKLDKRLSDLGATAVVERGLGDDQHPSGYEAALDTWLSSLWSRLNETKPHFFPKGPDFLVSNEELIGLPKVQVTYHNVDDMDSRLSTAT